MENFILGFREYSNFRNWEFGDYCSEFTFQFRICRYLESLNCKDKIELESNINRYKLNNLTKKEIDIDLTTEDNFKIAIELKFIRDKGSFNIGMFSFCEDIKFLEELTEDCFNEGYAIIFTNIKELYTEPKKLLNPRNEENIKLYHSFRNEKKISGDLNLKTGKLNKSLVLKGSYNLKWIDFYEDIKACIVKIK